MAFVYLDEMEFIHSFIADIYIAPLQVGLLRSAPMNDEAFDEPEWRSGPF